MIELSLVDFAGANFRTDKTSDELNTRFMQRLGMRQRYQPARLAIACSLSSSARPTELVSEDERGKIIKGDALFGTGIEMSVWLTMIMQHQGSDDIDIKQIVTLVGIHWRKGLDMLEKEWKEAEESSPQFVKRLVTAADLPSNVGRPKKL